MEGTRLGPYRIDRELGSGGMGRVWLAEAVERGAVPAGARVALKVVHPHLLSEPGFFKRFLREAAIGKAVAHPNVVRCHDCDQLVVNGQTHAFLVMEYVEGQTLRDLLDEMGTVPEELCRHVGREVSKGLAAIHAAGVVHRDLKPENVLITPGNEVKIMDLGVARLADEAIRLSRTGAFVGSPQYAAPEQYRGGGEDLDGRADLHALGLILYELSSGLHPFLADDVHQVLRKVLDEKPRRLGEVNPQLSAFFEEVVHCLLAKEREERFDSSAKLLEVLEEGEGSTWWGRRARVIRAETKRPLRRIRIPRETAVYGRETELAKLRKLYDGAKAGDGQVVLIEGEAGIGKTRLVDELIGRLRQDGEDLNFLFGSYPPGGAATASGAWSMAYREQFGAEDLENTLERYLTVTPVLVPAFAALLRGEPPPEGGQPLTKDSVQTVFVHATRALAEERTTIALIEDLHFAPEEGRGLFAALALAVPGHRILLLGTARPGIPGEWRADLERLDQADGMQLRRLGPKELGKLLVDAFRSERLAEELALKIGVKSDGNPFFVFEIIRGLREGQFISRRPDGTWVTTRVIRDIEIPSSVQDLIQVRISDLTEEEQEILDVAACCGFEFDPRLVGEVLGLSAIPALRRLGRLEKTHRLVRAAGSTFVFDHHQVQEALYEGISRPLREEYHAGIAEALLARHPDPDGEVAVSVCEHLFDGGRGERALPRLDAALDHLAAGYQNDRAVTLADRALETEGLLEGARRAEVLLGKAAPLGILGRSDLASVALEEASALATEAGEPDLSCRVRLARGRNFWDTGRYEEAAEEFEAARDLAISAGDRKSEGLAANGLGTVCHGLGRFDEAREHLSRGIAIAAESGDRKAEALAEGNLGNVFLALGLYEEGKVHHERHLALARDVGDRRGEGIATGNLGNVHWCLGEYEEAEEHFESWLAISREIGDRRSEAAATGNVGSVLLVFERLAEAGVRLRRRLAITREIGARRDEGNSLLSLGRLEGGLGDLDGAGEKIGRAREILREIGVRQDEGFAISGLGEVAEAAGDTARARSHFEEALALFLEIGHRVGTTHVRNLLGQSLLSEGRYGEAEEQLQGARELGRELGLSVAVVLAEAGLALLPGADPAPALEAFAKHEAGITAGVRMEIRFLHYRATNDPAHLREAHDLLESLLKNAPEDARVAMVENVSGYRRIREAWEARGEVV